MLTDIDESSFSQKGKRYLVDGQTTSSLTGQQSGGSIPTMYFALLDIYGQIVGTDDSSTITVAVST